MPNHIFKCQVKQKPYHLKIKHIQREINQGSSIYNNDSEIKCSLRFVRIMLIYN